MWPFGVSKIFKFARCIQYRHEPRQMYNSFKLYNNNIAIIVNDVAD